MQLSIEIVLWELLFCIKTVWKFQVKILCRIKFLFNILFTFLLKLLFGCSFSSYHISNSYIENRSNFPLGSYVASNSIKFLSEPLLPLPRREYVRDRSRERAANRVHPPDTHLKQEPLAMHSGNL